jgi:hypothetical protein
MAPAVPAGSILSLTVPPEIEAPHGAGVLAGPLVWDTGSGPTPSTRMEEIGLADFSGMVIFGTTLDLRSPSVRDVRLVITGLVGSARITVDGESVATILDADSETDLGDLSRESTHTLEIATSNTLVNVWSRLPSPYADRTDVGGGFDAAELHLRP